MSPEVVVIVPEAVATDLGITPNGFKVFKVQPERADFAHRDAWAWASERTDAQWTIFLDFTAYGAHSLPDALPYWRKHVSPNLTRFRSVLAVNLDPTTPVVGRRGLGNMTFSHRTFTVSKAAVNRGTRAYALRSRVLQRLAALNVSTLIYMPVPRTLLAQFGVIHPVKTLDFKVGSVPPLRPPNSTDPIDAVVMWVDGSDPAWQRDLESVTGKQTKGNSKRFKESGELRFCLRSIWKHAPFVRRVFLVTARPQVPDWLDVSHPRITVVHHDEVSPSLVCLPTFNSSSIEIGIVPFIPGLSDVFLYFNDDMFLGSPTTRGTWLTSDGKLKAFQHHSNLKFQRKLNDTSSAFDIQMFYSSLVDSGGEDSDVRPAHQAMVMHRPSLVRLLRQFRALARETCLSQTRTSHRFKPNFNIYAAVRMMLSDGVATAHAMPTEDNVYIDLSKRKLTGEESRWLRPRADEHTPLLLCCNDASGSEESTDRWRKFVEHTLLPVLGEAAPWEKNHLF